MKILKFIGACLNFIGEALLFIGIAGLVLMLLSTIFDKIDKLF